MVVFCFWQLNYAQNVEAGAAEGAAAGGSRSSGCRELGDSGGLCGGACGHLRQKECAFSAL